MKASWLTLVNKKVNFSFSISHTTLRPPLLTWLSAQWLHSPLVENRKNWDASKDTDMSSVQNGPQRWWLFIELTFEDFPHRSLFIFHRCLTGDTKLNLEVLWSLPTKWPMKNFHILKCWTMTEENVEKKQRVLRRNNTNFRKLRSLIPKFT